MRLPQMGSQSAEQGPSPVYQELPHEELPPVAVIGGLLTGPECEGWYRRTLDIDQESELPTNKRFIAPYKRGLGSIADMKEDFEERLQGLHEDADNRKLFLVGHSLGGLMATMAAVERPDLVAGVVSLGGVHEGYRVDTAATHALKFLFGRHPEAGIRYKYRLIVWGLTDNL